MDYSLQNLGIIAGILTGITGSLTGIYGVINSRKANKRLDDEATPIFSVMFSQDKSHHAIDLQVRNNDKNSIFIKEIRPINFKEIIPGHLLFDNGLGGVVYGEPNRTYKIKSEEIHSNNWSHFHFKAPKHLKRIKVKVIFAKSSPKGLKDFQYLYDYFVPESYL